MARVSTYNTDTDVSGNDKVLGSDISGATKNYTLDSIGEYFTKNNVVSVNSIDPEFLGLHKSSLHDIQIETKQNAIESFVGVLNNTANQSMIETTALNAAAGLLVGNVVDNFEDGVEL